MLQFNGNFFLLNESIGATTNSSIVNCETIKTLSIVSNVDVNAPASVVFSAAAVDIDDDFITKASHGMATGLKGQFTTTGTLPAGLALLTDYWIIKLTASTFAVAASLSDAQAGTRVVLVDQGSGNHTFTPAALAGGVAKIQFSYGDIQNPNSPRDSSLWDWFDIPTGAITNPSQNITADVVLYWEKIDVPWPYVRINYALTAGQYNPKCVATLKK